MVVVKQGDLPAPGKQYRLYLNADRKRNKWYLRVTHSFPHTNRHFRAGTYDSKEEALKAAETLDPINPKKGRSKPGTVDRYSNGMWRVRVKYKGEHMHVGYYTDENLAKVKLQEALADPPYLEERYQSLLAKRRRKTYAKMEKKKRKCENMEGFDQFQPASKRHYQRQNIISPITDTDATLPKLSPSTTKFSIEDYNAFLSAEQQQSHPAFTPDYPNLYHKFLNQEKVKKERSFGDHPLKSEFVRNEPLEWCEFGQFTMPKHSASQLYGQPAASLENNAQPQPPSFKATIMNNPTARYLDSTIPETLQQQQFPPNQNSMQLLADFLHEQAAVQTQIAPRQVTRQIIPPSFTVRQTMPQVNSTKVGFHSPFLEANNFASAAHMNELSSVLAQETKYQSLYPFLPPDVRATNHQTQAVMNNLATQYSQALTNNHLFQ